MKVLFAVSDEAISQNITKQYQEEYKEIITSTNKYFFNAIIKELAKDKTYDVIVISEDLEPVANNNYDQIDKFILEKLDDISDEATKANGEDVPIIFICSDRRTRNDDLLRNLFSMGIYNALVEKDRNIPEVCRLINRPRAKRDAKRYYLLDGEEATYNGGSNALVSEDQINNILNYYSQLGAVTEKYSEVFDHIAQQYDDSQLRLIIKFLPENVKTTLEKTNSKYQQLVNKGTVLTNGSYSEYSKKQESDLGSIYQQDLKSQKLSNPVVIPEAMNFQTVHRQPIMPNTQQPMGQRRPVAPISQQGQNAGVQRQPMQRPQQPIQQPAQNPFATQQPMQNPFDMPQQGQQVRQNPYGQNAGIQRQPMQRQQQPVQQPAQNPFAIQQPMQNPFDMPQQGQQVRQNPYGQNSGMQRQPMQKQQQPVQQPMQNPFDMPQQPVQNPFDMPQQPAQNPFDMGSAESVSNPFETEAKEDTQNPFDLGSAEPSIQAINPFDSDSADQPKEPKNEEIAVDNEPVSVDVVNDELADIDLLDVEPVNDEIVEDSVDALGILENQLENIEINEDSIVTEIKDEVEVQEEVKKPKKKKSEKVKKVSEDKEEIEEELDNLFIPAVEEIKVEESVKPEEPKVKESAEPEEPKVKEPAEPEINAEDLINNTTYDFFNDGGEESPQMDMPNMQMNDPMMARIDTTSMQMGDPMMSQTDMMNMQMDYPMMQAMGMQGFSNFNMNDYQPGEINGPHINGFEQFQSDIQPEDYNDDYEIKVDMQTIDTNTDTHEVEGMGKVVAFIGTSKNGTSFLVDSVGMLLSQAGIKTAIVDTTKNKNSYYMFTNNNAQLGDIASSSLKKLAKGQVEGLELNKLLTVFTGLPGDIDENFMDIDAIVNTLAQNFDVVLLDCDFETNDKYFEKAKELYLVQTMDAFTIQPLTKFLSELKLKGLLDENKLRIVINKYIKMKKLSYRMIIGGLAKYNEPAMTLQRDLFDPSNVPYILIPFDNETYEAYLQEIAMCDFKLNNYSDNFLNALETLKNMLFEGDGNQEKGKKSFFNKKMKNDNKTNYDKEILQRPKSGSNLND